MKKVTARQTEPAYLQNKVEKAARPDPCPPCRRPDVAQKRRAFLFSNKANQPSLSHSLGSSCQETAKGTKEQADINASETLAFFLSHSRCTLASVLVSSSHHCSGSRTRTAVRLVCTVRQIDCLDKPDLHFVSAFSKSAVCPGPGSCTDVSARALCSRSGVGNSVFFCACRFGSGELFRSSAGWRLGVWIESVDLAPMTRRFALWSCVVVRS